MHETVLQFLEATACSHGPRPAMRVRRGGRWEAITWTTYRELVRRAARGLMAQGVSPGAGVTIMGFNRPEWFVADLAAMAALGLPAGIYTTSTPEQCRYIADHAGAAVAIVENRDYLERFLEARDRLPNLRAIVVMEAGSYGDGVLSWSELLDSASSVEERELDCRIAAARPEDPCTLIYTSGTTGAPKAVTLTHGNVTWVASRATDLLDVGVDDRLISYLPLSHIAEQVVSLYLSMATGACVHFAQSLERLADDLREVRPHVFLGVPRVWEKIQAAVQIAAAQRSPLEKRIGAWARRTGLAAGYAQQHGGPRSWTYTLADRLVFSKVREKLGLDAARLCVVSAAPTALETLEFFLSLGIPIMEIYGMSECTGPATISLPAAYRTGWAGRPLPGTEMKTAEDGEILMRGPHVFKGYYGDEAATREARDAEGWLHSGDIGEIDEGGFVRVTDRKKELIITAGGKNVAPQLLEGRLKQIPAVSQGHAVGDRRPYVVALLTLDPARVAEEAERAGSPARSTEDAARCPLFKSRVDARVQEINKSLARYEQVKRFALLPRELTVDADELTATMKLKRRVIHERYRDVIEALYA